MKKKYKFLSAIFFTAMLCVSCGNNFSADKNSAHVNAPQRIISFAPSITEILYALGVGDNVVGVTNFCDYPPQAKDKAKVGDFANFNYEMILRLAPDLAIIIKEQQELIPFFERYKIKYITAGSDSIEEIIESIEKISDICDVSSVGDSIIQNMREKIGAFPHDSNANLQSSNAQMQARKILLCTDRDGIGSGVISQCFAAGEKSFYNQLIHIAGGVNVVKGIERAYPILGAEAIIRLDPDIIIDISSSYSKVPRETICNDWNSLKNVAAVKHGRVHCLTGDYITRPGPRLLLMLDDLRGIINL